MDYWFQLLVVLNKPFDGWDYLYNSEMFVVYTKNTVPQNSITKINTLGLTKTSTATGALYYVNRVDIVVQERP